MALAALALESQRKMQFLLEVLSYISTNFHHPERRELAIYSDIENG
jgi:hypothetical protein